MYVVSCTRPPRDLYFQNLSQWPRIGSLPWQDHLKLILDLDVVVREMALKIPDGDCEPAWGTSLLLSSATYASE